MNDVELAEHRLTVALFLDMEKQPNQWLDRDRAQRDYSVKLSERLFASISKDMEGRGWADTWTDIERGEERTAVMLRPERHAKVLERILGNLDARTFSVDWQTKRIITDAEDLDSDNLLPCPDGWMLLFCDRKRPEKPLGLEQGGTANHSRISGTYTAGRDVINIYGSTTHSNSAPAGESGWTKWGTIGTFAALILAAAVWYFSDDFPWKAAPKASASLGQHTR